MHRNQIKYLTNSRKMWIKRENKLNNIEYILTGASYILSNARNIHLNAAYILHNALCILPKHVYILNNTDRQLNKAKDILLKYIIILRMLWIYIEKINFPLHRA